MRGRKLGFLFNFIEIKIGFYFYNKVSSLECRGVLEILIFLHVAPARVVLAGGETVQGQTGGVELSV